MNSNSVKSNPIALLPIAVFLVLSFLGDTENAQFMFTHGACYTPAILDGEYWRLLTGMFLHFGAVHLIMNMVCLISIGDMLETMAGPVHYLVIFLLGGLAGNLVSMAWDMHTLRYAVSAGASGAVFAVIGALFVYMLRTKSVQGERMVRRMGIMVVLMAAEGFTQTGTDNAAHIGGLLAGMLLALILPTGSRGRFI
jgi:rhomboid protease GluP